MRARIAALHPKAKTVLRELAVLVLFAAMAVALTWPLAANLPSAVNDLGDPLLVTWILDWVSYALIHQPLRLYEAPIFHPGLYPLAYSENLVAVALLTLPLHLAGAPPIFIYNIAYLLGFALSGYGAFVLCRMVTKETVGALVGGIFFAFCSYKFDHVAHLHIIFSAWVPLLLAALLAFWEKATWKRGALLTLVWVANGLTNIYFLMFGAVAVLFSVALLASIRPRGHRFYVGLATSTLLAVALLLPFLLPYRAVSKHYQMVRSEEDVRRGSAGWVNWLVPGSPNRMYGSVPAEPAFQPEKQLFPGLLILILSGAGWLLRPGARSDGIMIEAGEDDQDSAPVTAEVAQSRPGRWLRILDASIVALLGLTWALLVTPRVEIQVFGARLLAADRTDIPLMAALILLLVRFSIRLPRAFGGIPLRDAAARSRFGTGAWVAAVWIVVGFVGSFGLDAFLYTFFYLRFEPFQAMRVPARFAVIAYAGLAVWGALGVRSILRPRQGWPRRIVAALLLLLMTADVMPRVLWENAPIETPPVYSWLAETAVGPVLELPFSGDGVDYLYLLWHTQHRTPIVNGTSGFFPAEFWQMHGPDSRNDFDSMLALAEKWGVKLIVVHGSMFTGARHGAMVNWLRRNLESHRLEFLRRFDHDLAGDYVFAITRNLPGWAGLRAPEVPDGGGFLPQQALERFFEARATHSDAIIVTVDFPQAWTTVRGPLRVSGWTLSPHGVKRVTVLLESGKRRYEAQRGLRPDVLETYPSLRYYNDRPGYELILAKRPDGISTDTFVQVEVEDLAGRVRRGKSIRVRWER